MESREFGPLSVSTVGLGCNNFGRELSAADSAAVVDAALEEVVDFFDTADIYGWGDHSYSGTGTAEEFLGAALGARRKDVVIGSSRRRTSSGVRTSVPINSMAARRTLGVVGDRRCDHA